MTKNKKILNAKDMTRTIERLAYQVIERHGEDREVCLIGIQRRGVDLAARIKSILESRMDRELSLGKLDINLYRDDWTRLDVQPHISQTEIPFDIDGKDVLLVDDVLFTGRTVRAALDAILDFGRPNRVELLVLVDRGHREFPICADYVGKVVDTEKSQHVDVYVKEKDGRDEVCLAVE